MSYCVKHATTFHTQTCERCGDESTIARLRDERDDAWGELEYCHRCSPEDRLANLRACQKCIADLTAEVERLRASKERLVRLVKAYQTPAMRGPFGGGTNPRLREIAEAAAEVNLYKDLAPPAKGGKDEQ